MWDRRQFIKTAAVLAAASLTGPSHAKLGAAMDSGVTYTVRKGDTLTAIAGQFGVTANEIRNLNGLTGDRINIGQILIVKPAPQLYIVQSGDTLGQIASRHNTTVSHIQAENNLTGDRIFPGQELVVSGTATGLASTQHIGEVIKATQALKARRRAWKYIVAHHSGVNSGNAAIYDRFHRRKMKMPNGLAYHFVIGNGSSSGNGEIEIGDRWIRQLQGGHVRDYRINDVGIGICLVGNFEERHPTSRQMAAFTELVSYLKNGLLGGGGTFTVHREVDGNRTLCPGKNFPTTRMHQLFS